MGCIWKCALYLPVCLVAFSLFLSYAIDGWMTKYVRNPLVFSLDAMPADLSAEVAVVTGANSGIGFVTARELTRRGATVLLGCRSASKCEDAKARIQSETGRSPHVLETLDLSSLKSVAKFASAVVKSHSKLTLLVNNAGVMACPYSQTADGLEMQFGTNHMGHFALTKLLLSALKQGGQPGRKARVINLSSSAHDLAPTGGIDFGSWDRPDGDWYKKWEMYGQSKMANLLFTRELDRQMLTEGANVFSVAVHPGFVKADLSRHLTGIEEFIVEEVVYKFISLSTEDGALTSLYTATADGVEDFRGEYFVPLARHTASRLDAYNSTLSRALWDESERLMTRILG
ncbi:unnamed protein product [Polarella glacialis]|uniref:Protochlorophyllide reductase n=1 Tax=Polarella glacialis TaxID=89957 RepID=A0A813LNK4_POLGL|nr:unnamed protein product [Polarella glacialis]